jgi:hypothetical protein
MIHINIIAVLSMLWATVVVEMMVLNVPAYARTVDLNGEWDACEARQNDDYAAINSRARSWQPVTVPARNWPTDNLNQAPAVWARRNVVVPDNLAGHEGVLHWGRVQWGAKAWVNGVFVGESSYGWRNLICPCC